MGRVPLNLLMVLMVLMGTTLLLYRHHPKLTHGFLHPAVESGAPDVPTNETVEMVNASAVANVSASDGDSKGKGKGKVVMITASSGTHGFASIPKVKEMAYENRKAYAERWGYEFLWANITSYNFGAKIYWNKIPILREAFDRFPEAEWIWWLDLDIIIMTPSLELYNHILSPAALRKQSLVNQTIVGVGGGPLGFTTHLHADPEDMNMVIAMDHWGQNVGSFFMRRSTWTDWALDMWADPLATAQNWTFPENDGWTHLYKHHPIVRNHTAIVNQRSINAYPSYNGLGKHWQAGDLLVHFAGCGASEECPGRWNDYWDMREDYDVSESLIQELESGTTQIESMQKGDFKVR